MTLTISSSSDTVEMVTIPCVFAGNIHRIDTCQGAAAVFFKTSKGTIWPFCRGCSDRHKDTAVQLVADQRIEVLTAVGSTFDIPLDDPDTLAEFRTQDPQRIQRFLDQADAAFKKKP